MWETELLKPCPICGETPEIIFAKGYGWTVSCKGHHETNWFGTEDCAIETWNEEVESKE